MTTAHRPTWKAAVGRAQEGGWSAGGAISTAKSILDAPSHTRLKTRSGAQSIDNIVDRRKALKESLKKLEEAESKASKRMNDRLLLDRRGNNSSKSAEEEEEEGRLKLLKSEAEVDEERLRLKYDDADEDDKKAGNDDGWSDVEGDRGEKGLGGSDESDLDTSDSDSDDDSDDEDDEAALQMELAKIRAEREAAKAKAEAEAAAEEEKKREEAALIGNPLLAGDGSSKSSGKLKRRWNEDVVFRNQARGEVQPKKRFINDTVRNDFHKRFLDKFIK